MARNTNVGRNTSIEPLGALPPFEDPKPPVSPELDQQPESVLLSNIYSTYSTSSSVVTGEYVQPQVVPVGLKTFTLEDLSEATKNFSKDNLLGVGGFGSVYRGVLAGGDRVAIKQLKKDGTILQGEREFRTEINVISHIHHRNLVSLVGYCISGPERLLVYEYMEKQSLDFHLRGTKTPAVLDWATRMCIALGAAKGIAYLREECHPSIIHRDIKAANILLGSNFIPKVGDFGLARFVLDDKTLVSKTMQGTFGYLDSDYGSSGRLTDKSDVYSFGVVILELITGQPPLNLIKRVSKLLDKAMKDGNFENGLVDPKLAQNYKYEEMNRMAICAAVCVKRFPEDRPRMSQVVNVLEGNISPEKLKVETSSLRLSIR